MTQLTFTKATKEQAKLRLAIFGPSGSGKTFTSLRMATGMGGKVAVIDTERGSASKYADRFDFDVLELPTKNIQTYVAAINAAAGGGYQVLIVDSLTHAWHDLLQEVDRLARAKYRGNTWSAWSEGTPKQRLLVEAILDFDGHIIATMRTKTEWTTESAGNGKSKPVRVGLAPEQGKGIEYEFDLLMEISVDHIAHVIKDRTGKYQDELIDKPDENFGAALSAWLNDGAKVEPEAQNEESPPAPAPGASPTFATYQEMYEQAVVHLGYDHAEHAKNALKKIVNGDSDGLTKEAAWQLLKDHQAAKAEDTGVLAEEPETDPQQAESPA